MTDETANGRATIREVYDIVARIETKLEGKLEQHDGRLRALERGKAKLAGAIGVIGLVSSSTLLVRFLH